jgi:hypothetical protein
MEQNNKRQKIGPLNADAANVRYHNLPSIIGNAEKILNNPINLSERRPLHGLGGGAEKASGWSVGDVARGETTMPFGNMENYQQDPGEVNTVQTIRVAEALAPLPKKGVNINALDVSKSMPDSTMPTAALARPVRYNRALLLAARRAPHPSRVTLSEAVKMGLLRTSTDTEYFKEAVRIRGRDATVAAHASDQFNAIRPGSARTAVGAEEIEHAMIRDLTSGRFVRKAHGAGYNNVIAHEQPSVPLSSTLPASNAYTFTDRMDTPAINCLEQLPTMNPLGTMLLIDRGTFDPRFRSLTTYPAVVRARIGRTGV